MNRTTSLLVRSVANIIPSRGTLEKLLKSGKKLNIYCGFDATAPRLHLGHAVPFRKLQAFAQAGHQVTFLIGDFTTLVGDTSDKESQRPILTPQEIKQNLKSYQRQASKILDFSKIKVRFNSQWLSRLNFADVIKLCQHFSAADFYSRELIRKRLQAGKKVGLHEVLYSVMQGYDHYYLDTDLQIGATDQTFNMQAGRKLQKDLRGKESFVMTLDILIGTDGRKMSKTWNNAIWLEDPPREIFGKVMSLPDNLVTQYFTLATNLPLEEIKKNQTQLQANPLDLKKRLAWQITSELHDKPTANRAQTYFEQVFQKRQLPQEITQIQLKNSSWQLPEFLIKYRLSTSKSAARRLIAQGGLKINRRPVTDWQTPITLKNGDVIQVGKRRFIKIKV